MDGMETFEEELRTQKPSLGRYQGVDIIVNEVITKALNNKGKGGRVCLNILGNVLCAGMSVS